MALYGGVKAGHWQDCSFRLCEKAGPGMYGVEIFATVRQLVLLQGKSRREVARQLGISRDSVSKMCRYAAPPGYVRTKPVERPKIGALLGVIDAILDGDDTAPAKQRHTAKRVWQRLRDEHRFTGGYSTVRDYVRRTKTRRRELFVPLAHPLGYAQIDFGEAAGIIGDQRLKLAKCSAATCRTRMGST